jgi:hypothetical protein
VYRQHPGADELELDALEVGDELGRDDEGEADSPFSAEEEADLAAELLEIGDEAELERFLGNLVRTVARGAGGFLRSPEGRALGRGLVAAARRGLPWAGRQIGAYVGRQAGDALGRGAAALAGRVFGLELEGLSPDVQEYEVARKFVRLAGGAARSLVTAPPAASPAAAAKKAIVAAARRYAPGLVRGLYSMPLLPRPFTVGRFKHCWSYWPRPRPR